MSRNTLISEGIERAEAGLLSARKLLRGSRAGEAGSALAAVISSVTEVMVLLDQDAAVSEAGTVDLWAVNWVEYEAGWGHRPDGHTLYTSHRAAESHLRRRQATQSGATPSVYSSPGTPFRIEVSPERYAEVARHDGDCFWGDVNRHIGPIRG